ncbi:MAG: class I SAM-dependent methyltransferase [Chlamydiales bacterium]
MEIDLLKDYPKIKRDLKARGLMKTEEDRKIARKFGKDFFDGDRKHGYGGFFYQPRFWQPVVPAFQAYYRLSSQSKVLDIGCAKGFMLYDFSQLIHGISVKGIDISKYAIDHGKKEVREYLEVGDARSLPFEDDTFDLVVAINTIHNLEIEDLKQALREIERVSKKNSFITVDAYRNEKEKASIFDWNLTAQTILHVDEWKALFDDVGYTGDYYWFIPLSP